MREQLQTQFAITMAEYGEEYGLFIGDDRDLEPGFTDDRKECLLKDGNELGSADIWQSATTTPAGKSIREADMPRKKATPTRRKPESTIIASAATTVNKEQLSGAAVIVKGEQQDDAEELGITGEDLGGGAGGSGIIGEDLVQSLRNDQASISIAATEQVYETREATPDLSRFIGQVSV